MSSAENEPRALWSRLAQARPGLRALTLEERARTIAEVAAELAHADDALVARLAVSSGLSIENVRFGLSTTFGTFDEAALIALGRSRSAAYDAVALVLAGNVFTACARPMLLALLAGAPILAKAASEDAALPLAIASALGLRAPALAAACGVLVFGREDARRMHELIAGAHSVQVLGSDEAVAAIRAQCKPEQRFIGRGHGLGVGVVPREVLASPSALAQAAEAFALDIAAYDQRGCLSPQAIVCEGDGLPFAQLLFDALQLRAQAMPRGTLPLAAAAEQLQWRSLAIAQGYQLSSGERCAVCYRSDAPPRPSPGYRNIDVYAWSDAKDWLHVQLGPLARFVKAVGVAGPGARDSSLAAYVCEAGAMQAPPLDAALDGLHPLAGFTR